MRRVTTSPSESEALGWAEYRLRGLLYFLERFSGWRQAAVVSALTLIPLVVSSHGRSTSFNNYVRVAYAWLHGRMWIDYPGRWLDAVQYHGQWYGVDGPFPAVLMLPFVIWKGTQANETAVCIALAATCTGIAWQLFFRLGISFRSRVWLTSFFFAGTDLWWCAMLGDVWFMAQVASVLFTLAALLECAGKRRGWLVALLAFCAFESRFPLALALPLYAWLVWTGALLPDISASAARGKRELTAFAGTLAGGIALWITYNMLMWGSWNDIGHTLYFHQDTWGQKTGSPLSLAYFPYQFHSFFFQGPVLVEWLQRAKWPFFKVDPHGVALTFTSPALALAFLARTPRRLIIALWLTTALVAAPSFLYYLNGWYQFGMRHALDFEPFLLLLMAIACRVRIPAWGSVLIVWSIGVGAWGVWWWNTFMRITN